MSQSDTGFRSGFFCGHEFFARHGRLSIAVDQLLWHVPFGKIIELSDCSLSKLSDLSPESGVNGWVALARRGSTPRTRTSYRVSWTCAWPWIWMDQVATLIIERTLDHRQGLKCIWSVKRTSSTNSYKSSACPEAPRNLKKSETVNSCCHRSCRNGWQLGVVQGQCICCLAGES